jgi:hypothetical protein
MSADQGKHLSTDAPSWWEGREEPVFWATLLATALFVFISVNSAGDGYDHPPLITIGSPLAATIGFPISVVIGVRLFQKFPFWKVFLAAACMAALPVVVMYLLQASQTPPNVHGQAFIGVFLYVVVSELTAVCLLMAALIRKIAHKN